MRARTVTDVILGEAVSGTPAERYRDMQAIASVMVNRANALGVSLEDVVQNSREFNAYNRALPAGVNAYRGLAERALNEVLTTGPVNNATFYATPAAADNLPNGLAPVDQTTGHVYYTDPYNRAIGTAIGYRQPNPQAYQQITSIDENNLPIPSPAPRGLLDTPATQPAGMSAAAAPLREQPQSPDYSLNNRLSAPMTTMDGLQGALEAQKEQARSLYSGPTESAGMSGLLGPMTTMDGLKDALNAQTDKIAGAGNFGILGQAQAAQAAQPTGPSPATMAEQYGQYGQGQLAMQQAMANANLAADVADQQGLLASVKTGRLPAMTQPTQPGYVDPAVNAQPQVTAPMQAAPAMTPAPAMAAPAQAARPAAAAGATPTGPELGRLVERQMMTRSLLGGIGGGLLGGALLGPVGAAVGGLLGRNVTKRSYYPPAPDPVQGKKSDRKFGYGDLNDYGRDAYDSSPQVRDVVDNDRPGLW